MSASIAISGGLTDDSLASAGQLRLTWLRFKRHRLAFISLFIVALFYLVAIFADFLAINDPHAVDARRGYLPPQAVQLFDSGGFNPYVNGMTVSGKAGFAPAYLVNPQVKEMMEQMADLRSRVKEIFYNNLFRGYYGTNRTLKAV